VEAGVADPLAHVARQLQRDADRAAAASMANGLLNWPNAIPGPIGALCTAFGKCARLS